MWNCWIRPATFAAILRAFPRFCLLCAVDFAAKFRVVQKSGVNRRLVHPRFYAFSKAI